MARRRIVLLHPTLLAEMLRGWPAMTRAPVGVWVESDAPADLRVVGCGFDEARNVIRVVVESETFPDIPDGSFYPEWQPLFTKHYDEMTAFEAAMAVLGGNVPSRA
jgi:hypothetical protein